MPSCIRYVCALLVQPTMIAMVVASSGVRGLVTKAELAGPEACRWSQQVEVTSGACGQVDDAKRTDD